MKTNTHPIYFDYMATTPLDNRVLDSMLPFMQQNSGFGNPASSHYYGLECANTIHKAKEVLANFINAASTESICFTSGATESINLAIKGVSNFYQRSGKHIITFSSEHTAVLESCNALSKQGFECTILPVKSTGLIDIDLFKQAIRPDTILVSVLYVNNEIGVIQDIPKIADITAEKGILLHVDAVQASGKVLIDVQAAPIDLLSLSAHKIYGPKGIGALYFRLQPKLHCIPLIHGGNQEYSRRSGTQATHQIVGLAKACELAQQEIHTENKRLTKYNNKLATDLGIGNDIKLNGHSSKRVPHNINIMIPKFGLEKRAALEKKIAFSTGSACNSHNHTPSHVLQSIGLTNKEIESSIRLSIGRFTTLDDINMCVKYLKNIK